MRQSWRVAFQCRGSVSIFSLWPGFDAHVSALTFLPEKARNLPCAMLTRAHSSGVVFPSHRPASPWPWPGWRLREFFQTLSRAQFRLHVKYNLGKDHLHRGSGCKPLAEIHPRAWRYRHSWWRRLHDSHAIRPWRPRYLTSDHSASAGVTYCCTSWLAAVLYLQENYFSLN